jgi:hypothetical protein
MHKMRLVDGSRCSYMTGLVGLHIVRDFDMVIDAVKNQAREVLL